MKFLIIGSYICQTHQIPEVIEESNIVKKHRGLQNSMMNHYSYFKGKLIGLGMEELGHEVNYLYGELIESVSDGKTLYLCSKDLTSDKVKEYDAIIFMKHNAGEIDNIINNCDSLKELFKNKSKINKNKLYKPYLVCKTCILPNVDYISKVLRKSIGDVFDIFFLQTPEVRLENGIIQGVLGIKEFYIYKRSLENYLSIKNVNEHLKKSDIICHRFNYSEMFVDKNIKFVDICPFKKDTKYTLIYIGRIRQNFGMPLLFLMKLMHKLGKDYKLIIIPGSFNLPNSTDQPKYNPLRERHIKILRNYVGTKITRFYEKYRVKQENFEDYVHDEKLDYNIEIMDPVNWGEQYKYIHHADVAINFSPNRQNGYNCQVANTKIFDYIASGTPIISETGCQNNYMIEKYGCGIVLNKIGSVDEYLMGIKTIISNNYDRDSIKQNFISNENYLERTKKIIEIFNKCGD